MSYFLIKQHKSGHNNKYFIDSTKLNLQAVLRLEDAKMLSLDEA